MLVCFPPSAIKIRFYFRIYENEHAFIEYNRFAPFDKNPSSKQIFFRVKNDEKKFFDIL